MPKKGDDNAKKIKAGLLKQREKLLKKNSNHPRLDAINDRLLEFEPLPKMKTRLPKQERSQSVPPKDDVLRLGSLYSKDKLRFSIKNDDEKDRLVEVDRKNYNKLQDEFYDKQEKHQKRLEEEKNKKVLKPKTPVKTEAQKIIETKAKIMNKLAEPYQWNNLSPIEKATIAIGTPIAKVVSTMFNPQQIASLGYSLFDDGVDGLFDNMAEKTQSRLDEESTKMFDEIGEKIEKNDEDANVKKGKKEIDLNTKRGFRQKLKLEVPEYKPPQLTPDQIKNQSIRTEYKKDELTPEQIKRQIKILERQLKKQEKFEKSPTGRAINYASEILFGPSPETIQKRWEDPKDLRSPSRGGLISPSMLFK